MATDIFDQVAETPAAPATDIFDTVADAPDPKASFFQRQAPVKSAEREAVTGVGGFAKGLALLSETVPMNADPFGGGGLPPEVQQIERERISRSPSQLIGDVQKNPLFEWGKAVQEGADEAYPLSATEKQGILTKIGGAAGGFLPMIASGPLAPATIGLQSAGEHLDTDYQAALKAGKSKDDAASAAIGKALASGTFQAALFEFLPAPLRKLGDKAIDKVAGGIMKRFLAGRVAQAGEGAALGAVSQAGENVIEGQPIGQGVAGTAAGLGGIQLLMPRGPTTTERDFLSGPDRLPDPNLQALAGTFGAGTPKETRNISEPPGNAPVAPVAQATSGKDPIVTPYTRPTISNPDNPIITPPIRRQANPAMVKAGTRVLVKRGVSEDVAAALATEFSETHFHDSFGEQFRTDLNAFFDHNGFLDQGSNRSPNAENLSRGLDEELKLGHITPEEALQGLQTGTEAHAAEVARIKQHNQDTLQRLLQAQKGSPNATANVGQQQENSGSKFPRAETRPAVPQNPPEIRGQDGEPSNGSRSPVQGAGEVAPQQGEGAVPIAPEPLGANMSTARSIIGMSPTEFRQRAAGFNKWNIELGRNASAADYEELKTLRDHATQRMTEARDKAKANPTQENLQDMQDLSVMPKFYNEAIAEYEKRVPPAPAEAPPVVPQTVGAPVSAVPPAEPSPPLPPAQAAAVEAAKPAIEGAPVGAEVNGYRKNPNGKWYKIGEDGNTKGNPAFGNHPKKLEEVYAQPPMPVDERTPETILGAARQVRVKVPEGATRIRVNTADGKRSEVHIADLNKGENPVFGVDVSKIEAGFIGKDGKFKLIPGDVKVEDVGRIRRASLSLPGEGETRQPIWEFHDAPPDAERDAVVKQLGILLAEDYGRGSDAGTREIGVRRVVPDKPNMLEHGTTGKVPLGKATWQALERTFGQKIVFVDSRSDTPLFFGGMVDPRLPEFIFINAFSPKPYVALFGHEFLHNLKTANPALYAEMTAKLVPLMKDFKRFWADLTHTYMRNRLAMPNEAKATEELVANFFGDSFNDPDFWNKLAEKEPGIFRKVADAVMAFIRSALAKVKGFGSYDQFKDVERAHDVVADAVSRFVKGERGPQVSQEGGPKFSLAKDPEEYRKFREFGSPGLAERTAGAYSDTARMKLSEADRLQLSPAARRLLNLPRSQEMAALGIGESHAIYSYQDARQWAENESPNIRWHVTQDALHSLGNEERRAAKLEDKLSELRKTIDSPAFQKRMDRLDRVELKAELDQEKESTFRNMISVKAAELEAQIRDAKVDEARADTLREDLKQARELFVFARGVGQRMDEIVSHVFHNYFEFGEASRTGQGFLDLYLGVRRGQGEPPPTTQELEYLRLASEVLAANRSLTTKLVWAERMRVEPDFAQAVNDIGRKLTNQLQTDPAAAIQALVAKEGKLAGRAAESMAAFKALKPRVMKPLEEYSDLEGAVSVDRTLKASSQWRDLVNTVNRDAGAFGIPDAMRDRIRKGVYNEFGGVMTNLDPAGNLHTFDLGATREEAGKAQTDIENYLKAIEDWLFNPENDNHPHKPMWQREHDFVDAVYNTMGVISPPAVKSLGPKFLRRSWTMPEFLLRQTKLPVAKVLQTALSNWNRAMLVASQWSSAVEQPLMRLIIDTARQHKMRPDLGNQEYREKLFNSLAWHYRNNREIHAGEKLYGITVTQADIAVLKKMGGAEYDLMNKVKNLGAERVMPQDLLFDEWAENTFAIRRPQEFGALPRTTVSRDFSSRAKAAGTEFGKLSPADTAKAVALLNSEFYFEPFVHRWIAERGEDYSTLTPFEPLLKQLAEKIHEGGDEDTKSIEAIVDFIARNTDDTYDNKAVQDMLVGNMVGELRSFYDRFVKADPEQSAEIRVIRATRDSAFTTGFSKDVGSSFFYNYGMMSRSEVRSTAIDSTMFHLTRFERALHATQKVYEGALIELDKVKGNEQARLAFLAKQKALFHSGDDFRDFEDLKMHLNEIKAYRERLGIWSGQQVAQYEGLSTLYRMVSDDVISTLAGLGTSLRVFTGSAIKQAAVLSAMDRHSILSLPKAAVSMAMSTFNIGVVGPLKVVGRRVGLVAPLEEAMSGIAEEIFRSGKYFDQQYSYGLGTKNPTLDSIWNNLRAPATHGGGYDVQFSGNRGIRLLEQGAFKFWAGGETFLELIKTIFPALPYAIAYDSVARNIHWNIKSLEARARRSFDTHEKLGTLSKFDLANPKKVQNRLTPKEVLADGFAPVTQTQLDLVREFFRRGTDMDLNDAIMTFWSRLAESTPEQRKEIHLLSADATSPEQAVKLTEARSGALASVGLLDIHHASPVNRMWALRQSWYGRLMYPISGWAVQSTRQWFALMGKAQGDPRFGPKMLTALTTVTILGALGVQTIGGDLEKRIFSWMKWLAFKEVDPVKHLGQGRNATEEAQIAISDATGYITALNNLVDMFIGEKSNRTAAVDNMFLVEKIKSVMAYVSGVAHTKDPTYGLAAIAKREAPWLRPLINRTPGEEGLVVQRNVRTILAGNAPEELVRKASPVGAAVPTELSPIVSKLANAVYKRDSQGVAEAHAEFIAKATALGRSDPEKLFQQVMRGLNPYSALASHPTDEQRAQIIARLSDRDRQILTEAEGNYLAAADSVGVNAELVKQDRSGGTGGSGSTRGTSGTSLPSLSGASVGGSGGSLPSGRIRGLGTSGGIGRIASALGGTRRLRTPGRLSRRLGLSGLSGRKPRLVKGRLKVRSGRVRGLKAPRKRHLTRSL